MRVFGTKQVEPTDEDRAAAARLSAVAARFKTESDFTETSPDPIGEPEPSDLDSEEPAEPDSNE